jgi:hypothetical protein
MTLTQITNGARCQRVGQALPDVTDTRKNTINHANVVLTIGGTGCQAEPGLRYWIVAACLGMTSCAGWFWWLLDRRHRGAIDEEVPFLLMLVVPFLTAAAAGRKPKSRHIGWLTRRLAKTRSESKP